MMGIPFSGFVDGVGYVLSEVVVTPYPINKSGTHFMWGIHREEYLYVFDESDYSEDTSENKEDIGYLDMLEKSLATGGGVSLNVAGNNTVPTRVKPWGATKGTSMASEYFRYHFFLKNKKTPYLLTKIPSKITIPIKKPNLHLPFIGTKRHIPLMQGSANVKLGPALRRLTPVAGSGFTIWGAYQSTDNIVRSNYSPKIISQEISGWGTAYMGAKLGAAGGGSCWSLGWRYWCGSWCFFEWNYWCNRWLLDMMLVVKYMNQSLIN